MKTLLLFGCTIFFAIPGIILTQYTDTVNKIQILYPKQWAVKQASDPHIIFKAIYRGSFEDFGMLSINMRHFEGKPTISLELLVKVNDSYGFKTTDKGIDIINNEKVYWTKAIDPLNSYHLQYTYVKNNDLFLVDMGVTKNIYDAEYLTIKKSVSSFKFTN